jgi:hypothetical protein
MQRQTNNFLLLSMLDHGEFKLLLGVAKGTNKTKNLFLTQKN